MHGKLTNETFFFREKYAGINHNDNGDDTAAKVENRKVEKIERDDWIRKLSIANVINQSNVCKSNFKSKMSVESGLAN